MRVLMPLAYLASLLPDRLMWRACLDGHTFQTWAAFCWPFVGWNGPLWRVTDGKR